MKQEEEPITGLPENAFRELKPGEVLLLENLRYYAEEEGKPRGLADDASDEEKKAAKAAVKESQKKFVADLASLGDVWINDAFGTAHRAHASTALIAKYFPNDKLFGYVMEGELKAVDSVMKDPKRPFTAIMGGSKVSSKIEIIENLLNKVDNLIIAGGMTYTFTKAMGGKIGISICEDDKLDLALDLIKKAKELGMYTILRYFLLDSMAFENIRQQQHIVRPDFIEVLPGVMPRVIKRICGSVKTPIIAGGLITDKEDVMAALSAGAIAVSSTNHQVWKM